MRHRRDGRKLGITATHRRAMLANMVTSLFRSERIETTVPKAKEARRLAERLITFARRGNAAAASGAAERKLAARRHVARIVQDSNVLRKLFDEIAPRFADRPGGYTRIVRLGSVRIGDSARKAILELLKKDEEGRSKKKASRKTYHKIELPTAPGEKAPRPAETAAESDAEQPAAGAAAPAQVTPKPKAHPAKPKAGAPHPKKEKAHKAESEKKPKRKAAEKPKGKKK